MKADEIERVVNETIDKRMRTGIPLFTCGPYEHVVGVTPWRDCILIATTSRVMLYGPDDSIRTIMVP